MFTAVPTVEPIQLHEDPVGGTLPGIRAPALALTRDAALKYLVQLVSWHSGVPVTSDGMGRLLVLCSK